MLGDLLGRWRSSRPALLADARAAAAPPRAIRSARLDDRRRPSAASAARTRARSNRVIALAVFCIWSMASSIDGDQVLDVAAVERRDEGAAHGEQHLARDVVGVVLAVHDRLAVERHGLAAFQHGAQRFAPRRRAAASAGRTARRSAPPSASEPGTKPACPPLKSGVAVGVDRSHAQSVMNDAPRALFRSGSHGRSLPQITASPHSSSPNRPATRSAIAARQVSRPRPARATVIVVPAGGAKRQQAHDRPAADRLAASGDGDVGPEAFDGLDEFGRRARMQALAVDDEDVAHERIIAGRSRRAACDGSRPSARAHLPARTREATLMYLRPAS